MSEQHEEKVQDGNKNPSRVFESEEEFLAAKGTFNVKKLRGFVVTKGRQKFWVYATSTHQALGLVCARLGLLSIVTYERSRTVRNLSENEVLALFTGLPAETQDKIRRHLTGHVCPHCRQAFDSRALLNKHLRDEHPIPSS